jgi:hypothetical protein
MMLTLQLQRRQQPQQLLLLLLPPLLLLLLAGRQAPAVEQVQHRMCLQLWIQTSLTSFGR